MQAIMLAAGKGSRLKKYTKNNTKCMVKVNEITLLERVVIALKKANIRKLILVLGYEMDNVKEYIKNNIKDMEIIYIDNFDYDKTNNIYSLYMAKDYLADDDTILLESDLIFDYKIIKELKESPYENAAVVAKYEHWMDGTMVLLDENDNIKRFIEKKDFLCTDIDKYYKTVNIYKFSKEFSKNTYIPFLEAYIKANGKNDYYELVLKIISQLNNFNLKAFKLKEEKWYEIDDIQDLDISSTIFADESNKLDKYYKRYGGYWRFEKLKDFCYLVNPYFPPETMKSKMKFFFDELLINYPSGLEIQNICAARMFEDVDENHLLIGNGAAEFINNLKYILKGKIGTCIPTFNEYIRCFPNHKIININMINDDYKYNLENIFQLLKRVDNLVVVNPNNPTGSFIEYNDMIKILEYSNKNNKIIIIDESFIDFAEEKERYTLINDAILRKYKNLIVIKSISKSYGVPGLRLGVLATANQEIITKIKENLTIWNINSFAEYFLQLIGLYKKDFITACDRLVIERNLLMEKLKKINFLKVYESQANYVMCKLINKSSRELVEYLLNEHQLLIKDLSNKEGFNNGQYIRIAVRNRSDNNFLVDCLKKSHSKKEINNE